MSAPGDNLKTNASRLWDSLMEMAKIGPGIAGGNNRQTLTDEDSEGRYLFQRWCEEAGCTMGVDTMGNMFASATFNHYGEGDGVANAAPTKSAATGSVIVYGPPLNINTLPESLCNTVLAALMSTIFNSALLASGVWAIAAPTGAAIML